MGLLGYCFECILWSNDKGLIYVFGIEKCLFLLFFGPWSCTSYNRHDLYRQLKETEMVLFVHVPMCSIQIHKCNSYSKKQVCISFKIG